MKNQIKEGLIDKIMTMIAKGRVDSKVKKMMKDDPDFAKQVKKMRDAQNDLQKSLDNFIK
jgi:predicted transcriptional regulator|tara:strand:- start:11 stop:190 length:180 start_codon:yes stop_codon:yes gene_type:complete